MKRTRTALILVAALITFLTSGIGARMFKEEFIGPGSSFNALDQIEITTGTATGFERFEKKKNGEIMALIVAVPTLTGTPSSLTLSIVEVPGGTTLYSTAALDELTTTVIYPANPIPLSGPTNVVVTANAVMETTSTLISAVFYRRDQRP